MKRIMAMLLVLSLCFTSGGDIFAAVTDKNSDVMYINEKKLETGLMQPEVGVLPEKAMPEDAYDYTEVVSRNKYSAVYKHDWDKYSTNYYYNLLSVEEKELWDAMDELCIYYLNNAVTIAYDRSTDSYLMDTIKITFQMSPEKLDVFWRIFMYSNPQYYFLENSYWRYGDNQKATGIVLVCYAAFADGATRATATKNVQTQIEEWEKVVAEYSTDAEKLQVIYELVCDKVTYNYDFVNGLVSEEDCFSQSAYSVFCTDTTVCAGYADAMTVMCNAIGLDAVSITSYDHQWNKVRIDDVWYNYDATWGDGDSNGNTYTYYARSDEFYESDSTSHVEEDFWKDYSPNAGIDVETDDEYKPGTYPVNQNYTEIPSIGLVYGGTCYFLSFRCNTKGATIYYTLDGTEPSIAYTKASKYRGTPIIIEKSCEIKAIAVCDGYWDSSVQTTTIAIKENTLSYVLNGGTNDKRNPSVFSEISPEFELYPATREGYTFCGWYYDSAFTKPVGKIDGSVGNIVVYAKWEKIVEDIADANVILSETKYDYNGKVKTPTVTVILDGKTLTTDVDYLVSYQNNINIGIAKVTITGIDGYKGTIEKTFEIVVKKGVAFTSGNYKYEVTGTTTVKFKGIKSSSMKKVTIPKTVKYGGKSFKVTEIGKNALKNKTKVTTVVIGANVKTIGVSAFEGCKKLSKVTIGSAVTTIDDKTFKNCTALKSVTIPSKVTKIDTQAFYGCKNLKTITIKSTKLKTVGKNALKGIKSTANIKVPGSKLKLYKSLLKKKGQGSKVTIEKTK